MRVNHKLKLPMSQKNKSHTTVKLGFLTCVPPPGLPQQQRWMGIKKKVHKPRATESSIKRWILGLKLKLLVAHEEKTLRIKRHFFETFLEFKKI